MLCLFGLYFAPGIVVLTTLKFVFVFYLMRLTVHCNCIPKGRLFQVKTIISSIIISRRDSKSNSYRDLDVLDLIMRNIRISTFTEGESVYTENYEQKPFVRVGKTRRT